MGAGDQDRFETWMRARLGVLHRIARAFAAGADQQDLLQEMILAVWRAAPAFRDESAPATSSSAWPTIARSHGCAEKADAGAVKRRLSVCRRRNAWAAGPLKR